MSHAADHDFLDNLPPRAPLLVLLVRRAPELAVLAMLHDAIRVALLALVAEHPALDDLVPPPEPPTLRRARRLAHTLHRVHRAIEDYRRAVIRDLSHQAPRAAAQSARPAAADRAR